MTLEFQQTILKYLFQVKSAKAYIKLLDADVFDSPTDKQLYKILRAYVSEYKITPSRVDYMEFLRSAISMSTKSVSSEIADKYMSHAEYLYTPLGGGTAYIRDRIIDYAMRKKTNELALRMAEVTDKATDADYKDFYGEMRKIISLRDAEGEFEKHAGGFLFRDAAEHLDMYTEPEIHPFFLKQVNAMTAAGGFYAGQNIIFLGGAKRFKTGLLLNAAYDYAATGTPVFIADTENGKELTRARLKQVALACTRKELIRYRDAFIEGVSRVLPFGGDVVVHFFPPGSTVEDIDEVLTYYETEYGWRPKCIIHDYVDRYKPRDKYIRERRFQIQAVYADVDWLNAKWGTFSLTVSPITADANDKWALEEKDFGEDKAKIYNCTAAFAINRIKPERKLGTLRITPIAQREGVEFLDNAATTCAIKVDAEVMQITELDSETYLQKLQPIRDGLSKQEPTRFPKRNTVKDT
ncbi:MAG: hypothetical protein H6550_15975 [Chitinophagales bacterium]|nr:hypothetical protein [Chitinophagales bacterium]